MRPSPTILAALGVLLILSAPGGGEASSGRAAGSGPVAGASPDRAAGSDLAADEALRVTVAPLLSLTLERSCPPPGILACGPAIRVVARVPAEAAPRIAPLIGAGLRLAGYRRLRLEPRSGGRAGRVTSAEEVLASWRTEGGVLELATHGLELSEAPPALPRGGDGSLAPVLRLQLNAPTLSALR